jgi:hypothetical protein
MRRAERCSGDARSCVPRGTLARVTRRAALFVSLLFVVSSGCDSASVYEDCAKVEKQGTGEERCFPSTFAKEDERAREAAGFVSVGSERVPNALVSVNGKPTTTDSGGIYRFKDTPFRYDVAARIDDEVVAFSSAAQRFLDLALEREGQAKGFSGTVQLTVKDAPRAGNRLALFASGDYVVGLSGTIESGIIVSSRTFENDKAKLHVVEYPENGGLERAVAKGTVDVSVRAGTVTTATVSLDAIEERKTVTFNAASDVTDGLSFEDIEILFDMGSPLGRVPVRTMRFGQKVELPVIEDGSWLARTKATLADGAVASIGLRPFSPGDEVTLSFYAPPIAERNDGATLYARSAQGIGVFEHVLEPIGGAGGGATIHVFSGSADARVPDLAPLGLPPARGDYRWTVRVFPDFAFVEAMSGATNRLYRSSSTSSARTITLP